MTKLWECRFRGKYLATVHNVESAGLGTHIPDTDAIKAALPHYCRHMPLTVWATREPIGQTLFATVNLTNARGVYYHHSVSCKAVESI